MSQRKKATQAVLFRPRTGRRSKQAMAKQVARVQEGQGFRLCTDIYCRWWRRVHDGECVSDGG